MKGVYRRKKSVLAPALGQSNFSLCLLKLVHVVGGRSIRVGGGKA